MPESVSPAPCPTPAIGEWRKASYCSGGECVELAPLASNYVGLRDSKDPDGSALVLSRPELAALVDHIKAGGLDHLV